MNSIYAALTIGSFVAGLPFGPVGVALSFSVSGLDLPIAGCLPFGGRPGPVTAKDMWTGFFRQLPFGLVVACVMFSMLAFTAKFSPLDQLLACAPVGVVAVAGSVLLFTHQRKLACLLLESIRGMFAV